MKCAHTQATKRRCYDDTATIQSFTPSMSLFSAEHSINSTSFSRSWNVKSWPSKPKNTFSFPSES